MVNCKLELMKSIVIGYNCLQFLAAACNYQELKLSTIKCKQLLQVPFSMFLANVFFSIFVFLEKILLIFEEINYQFYVTDFLRL